MISQTIRREWPPATVIHARTLRVRLAETAFWVVGFIALAFLLGVLLGAELVQF